MKTCTLAVLLAALATVAQAGKRIGACGTEGGCPGLCRAMYGLQATGTCQDNEDFQRCICLNTNRPVKTGECDTLGGCGWYCVNKYGYQSDGFCQRSEDKERCICVNVEAPPFGGQGPRGHSGRVQHKRF